MKKTGKVLILGLCAVLLVTASVLGTMAYLTDNDTVTNTFTVGNVTITMDETDTDNSSGGVRDQENEYKLVPGQTYIKDPIIHVGTGSENCYLFVKVQNGIVNIEGGTKIADQIADNDWTEVDAGSGIYVYGTAGNPTSVTAGTDVPVFEGFTVDGTVDGDTLAKYADKTITVTAYAVQVEGFENKNASEIWGAAKFAG